jgi:hypothetical protein
MLAEFKPDIRVILEPFLGPRVILELSSIRMKIIDGNKRLGF